MNTCGHWSHPVNTWSKWYSIQYSIQRDFEAALTEGFYFDGVFAFSTRYLMNAAPNPFLNIDGLGAVGIPLSERDARAIISVSAPACGSSSSHSTPGIWEIPADKIHFYNPAWDAWIQTKAGVAAAKALSASSSVLPSFSFKKLVIHEVSAQTIHHKDPINEDAANTKIGDFVTILPSFFQGAQLHLRHAGQTKSLNFAQQSGLSTSIVAAYSGVQHTMSGVTSGYRLSLVYDIVQPITHAEQRPMLPEMQGALRKLYNVMTSWKKDTSGEAPKSLGCLLQHKYPGTASLHAQSLAGADALLISHLYPLARQLKFRLYLAQVRLTVTTTAEADDPGYGHRGRGGCWGGHGYSSDEGEFGDMDSEIDVAEFEDDDDSSEEALEITRVVDLHGMPVTVDLDLEAEYLLNGTLTEQDPDTEKFEREDRTTATRTKVYNGTVLLIWPKDGDVDLSVAVGDIYDYACHALGVSLTVAPTKREEKLIEQLLAYCQTRPQETKLPRVVQVLRECADRWNDVKVLLRALRACSVDKNTHFLGVEGFVSAYQAFGWAPLKDFCGDAMKNDISNGRRYALLVRLTQMAREEEDVEVSAWCTAGLETILRFLGKVNAAQVPWLVHMGLSRGVEFLRNVILPQLQAQNLHGAFWIPFIQRIQESIRTAPAASSPLFCDLFVRCVSEVIRTLHAFPTQVVHTRTGSHAQQRREKNPMDIFNVLKLCVETKNEVLCGRVFAKMRDAARLDDFHPESPPWQYYADVCPRLIGLISHSALRPADVSIIFRPFFVDVMDSMVSTQFALAHTTSNGKTITPCPLDEQHRSILMLAARHAGGIVALKERLTADVLKGHDASTHRALAMAVAKGFPKDKLQDVDALGAYTELTGALVRAAIATLSAPFPTRIVPNRHGYPYQTSARHGKNSAPILEAVKLCLDTQNEALRGDFLPEFPPWLYYLELVPSLAQCLQSVAATPAINAAFHPFFVDAIDSMISAQRTAARGKTVTPCSLNDQHRAIIMLAARKAGGITVLKQRLTAETLRGRDSATLQELARAVGKEFPLQQLQQDSDALQAFSDVIVTLVRAAIDAFDTATLKKTAPSYSYYGARTTNSPSDHMLALVKFCFELGAKSQCQRLLLRFVPPPAGSNVARHVSDVLAPFLPMLQKYLVSKRLDFQTDPYKMFAAAVIKAFAEKVMGQKPHEIVPAAKLQTIGCDGCPECVELKAFFCSDKQTVSFSRVQGIRTHLERQLAVTRSWGVVWETIKVRSPHTLEITKPASMAAIGLWSANSQTGKTLLHVLGDPSTQMRILGADYHWVHARIHGNAMPLRNTTNTQNALKRTPADVQLSNPAAKKRRVQ
ncbi:hypothetical protein B0H15DRAFT_927201 [Mycena belliarum]|uniref:Uncharacterized protein n=1 Tax=Mycena belliarum TaxID=1033014 RepID=A0AAD6UHG9_9AGAR|nr:hypothetical protein B0H15DRAFT_927201 [Mycena belliae]